MSDLHLSEYLELNELNYEYASNTILLIYTIYWCTRDRVYDTILFSVLHGVYGEAIVFKFSTSDSRRVIKTFNIIPHNSILGETRETHAYRCTSCFYNNNHNTIYLHHLHAFVLSSLLLLYQFPIQWFSLVLSG